jgi:hypothetical protein
MNGDDVRRYHSMPERQRSALERTSGVEKLVGVTLGVNHLRAAEDRDPTFVGRWR